MKKKMSEPINVCIIDDHSVVRMGFKYMLSFAEDMKFVGEAADGTKAAACVKECAADVVLLDVRMPWTEGHSALAEISLTRRKPSAQRPVTLVSHVCVSGRAARGFALNFS